MLGSLEALIVKYRWRHIHKILPRLFEVRDSLESRHCAYEETMVGIRFAWYYELLLDPDPLGTGGAAGLRDLPRKLVEIHSFITIPAPATQLWVSTTLIVLEIQQNPIGNIAKHAQKHKKSMKIENFMKSSWIFTILDILVFERSRGGNSCRISLRNSQ